jgi:hypothetical protein
MEMDKIPQDLNNYEKGRWIKNHWEEIHNQVLRVGKAKTARQLGLPVGTLYNIYARQKDPNYSNRGPGRPKKVVENVNLKMEEPLKPFIRRGRKSKSRSPVRAVDTLLRASKGDTFNNSLVQSVVTILEDYSKTKLELKSREEQVGILLEKIKTLEIELLGYRESSRMEKKGRLNEVLEKAKSSLITYGD